MYKDTIKADRIQAMRDKDSKMKSFLDVVLGEINSAEAKQDVTNEGVEKILQKMKQNSVDLKEKYEQDVQHEIDYFVSMLPSLVSNDELEDLIKFYIIEDTDLARMPAGRATGMIIKELKSDGIKFDSKAVKPIVDKILG